MSSGNSISATVPICTPTRRTGDPSARPLVLSKRVQYFVLRANSRCSLLIAMTPRANRIMPIDTNAPTLISFVALESCIFAPPPAAQELAQPGLVGCPGLGHGADKVHAPLEQIGDAVPDEERAVDVVRHHDRRDLDLPLETADQVVDRVRGHGIETRRRLVVEN